MVLQVNLQVGKGLEGKSWGLWNELKESETEKEYKKKIK